MSSEQYLTDEQVEALSRRELQAIAKQIGVRANQKSVVLIAAVQKHMASIAPAQPMEDVSAQEADADEPMDETMDHVDQPEDDASQEPEHEETAADKPAAAASPAPQRVVPKPVTPKVRRVSTPKATPKQSTPRRITPRRSPRRASTRAASPPRATPKVVKVDKSPRRRRSNMATAATAQDSIATATTEQDNTSMSVEDDIMAELNKRMAKRKANGTWKKADDAPATTPAQRRKVPQGKFDASHKKIFSKQQDIKSYYDSLQKKRQAVSSSAFAVANKTTKASTAKSSKKRKNTASKARGVTPVKKPLFRSKSERKRKAKAFGSKMKQPGFASSIPISTQAAPAASTSKIKPSGKRSRAAPVKRVKRARTLSRNETAPAASSTSTGRRMTRSRSTVRPKTPRATAAPASCKKSKRSTRYDHVQSRVLAEITKGPKTARTPRRTASSNASKGFDLQESLARPLGWKLKTGKLSDKPAATGPKKSATAARQPQVGIPSIAAKFAAPPTAASTRVFRKRTVEEKRKAFKANIFGSRRSGRNALEQRRRRAKQSMLDSRRARLTAQ